MGQGVGSRRKRHLSNDGQAVVAGLKVDFEDEGSKQAMKVRGVTETMAVSERNLRIWRWTAMKGWQTLFEGSEGSGLGGPSLPVPTRC